MFILLKTWPFFLTSTWSVCGKRILILNIEFLMFIIFFVSNSLTWCSNKRWLSPSSDCSFCSGLKSSAIFVLILMTLLIFARALLLKLKSMVRILIRPPIKGLLSSFSPIKSLNSSNIGWNMFLLVSPKPSVESLSSTRSSKISLICLIILFTMSVLASLTDLSSWDFCFFRLIFPLHLPF